MKALTRNPARPPLPGTGRGPAVVAVLDGNDLSPAAVAGAGVLETGPAGPPPGPLRAAFAGSLAYSEPLLPDGGIDRFARLAEAALGFDYVDLQWPADVSSDLLELVPPECRWITYRGSVDAAGGLARLTGDMSGVPAALLRVIVDPEEEVARTMSDLAGLHLPHATAFGSATSTAWSRLLAPWQGARVVFGHARNEGDSVWEVPDGQGLLSVRHLVEHYGFPRLGAPEVLFGIVGAPGSKSLSPVLHNAAYRELDIAALFLPFTTSSLVELWEVVLDRGPFAGMRGATVGSPFKEEALHVAWGASEMASASGGANLLLRDKQGWTADTTDSAGVVEALTEAGVEPAGWPAAVVGCGGAGRAAAAALCRLGASVTLVNRGLGRAQLASRLLKLEVVPLAGFDPSPYRLIVHATPVCEKPPFDLGGLSREAVILEMVYGKEPTALASEARARGQLTVDGWDVLIAEVRNQFRLMTGHTLPAEQTGALIESCRSGEVR